MEAVNFEQTAHKVQSEVTCSTLGRQCCPSQGSQRHLQGKIGIPILNVISKRYSEKVGVEGIMRHSYETPAALEPGNSRGGGGGGLNKLLFPSCPL